MPHADASNFATNEDDPPLTRSSGYESIIDSLRALITEHPPNRNWVSACANASSLLWHMYHSLPPTDSSSPSSSELSTTTSSSNSTESSLFKPDPGTSVNWTGFYILDPKVPQQIILGPFMGKVACQTMKFGQGVCGTVAKNGKSEIVIDVDSRPGHVACDGDSKSEIVVPVQEKGTGKVVAVLDIDCAVVEGFGEVDRLGLEEIGKLLGEECEW